nr:gustatory receptor 5 [Tropidothorax elegans]
MLKGKDIYWESFPPFFISRFLGVSSMDDQFYINKSYLGINMILLTMYATLSIYLWVDMESTNNIFQMSGFSLILERAQLIIIFITVTVSTIKSILNIKTLRGVIEHISFLDKNLHEIGVKVPYSRVYGYILITAKIILLLILWLSDFVLFKSYSNWSFLLVQFNLIFPLLVANVIQVQFMVLLELVQRRIRTLSAKLNDIDKGKNFVKTNHLHVLISVHSSLLGICEIINALYSPQILIILSSIFIVTTANLYHVIEKLIGFISQKKLSDLNFLAMTTYRIFVRSLEVWTMVTTCANTQELAREFNLNLYQLMIDDKSNEISANKKLRLHVTMNKEIVFHACGFFTLDYTLVHSMIAAATTYLVILVQFGLPSEKDKEVNCTAPAN